MTADEDNPQNLMCKAVKKTWANQRRKRRLAVQHQQTSSKRLKESARSGDDSEHKQSDIPVISQELTIESCDFEFMCILNRTDVNLVQFKWLHGDGKDNLHQITQYLKNQVKHHKADNYKYQTTTS